MILIDVGSTIIKYFKIGNSGEILSGGYFQRNYEEIVEIQVKNILQDNIGIDPKLENVRICSSANGGIKVGVIGYTERFSASWAEKAALNAGANVRWVTNITNLGENPREQVDIIIIAGGVEGSPVQNQIAWIAELHKLNFECESIVFSGNTSLHLEVKKNWPKAVLAKNVIGCDMRWSGHSLVEVIREAYLNDLILTKGISELKIISQVPILPTPAIVQASYEAMLKSESSMRLAYPLLLLDVGGATTDIYYGGELIADSNGNQPRPSINRHVFTYLGISVSRRTLIERLSLSENLGDFLRTLNPFEAEKRYLALREGETDWITSKFLAKACIFLALEECVNGLSGGHRLQLSRVCSVAITGGASQLCEIDELERIIDQFGIKNANVYIDKKYQIWINGMGIKLRKLKNK